jgi:hypothetical protein
MQNMDGNPEKINGNLAAVTPKTPLSVNIDNATPVHDKKLAELFLAALDRTADKFTFLSLHDTVDGRCRKAFHGTLNDYWSQQALPLNTPEQGFGAFVTINETDGTGRRTRANIIRARAIFADADSPEAIERCRAHVRATAMIPTMVVRSSPGRAHFYWRRDIPLDMFTPLQSALRDKLGTDNVTDLPRVMRLPGSLHLKQPDRPCLVTVRVFS